MDKDFVIPLVTIADEPTVNIDKIVLYNMSGRRVLEKELDEPIFLRADDKLELNLRVLCVDLDPEEASPLPD